MKEAHYDRLGMAGIIMGLVIVALAVGIPYFLTHKTMSSPHDLSEGRAYLWDKRRWMRRRAAAGLPQDAPRRRRLEWRHTGRSRDIPSCQPGLQSALKFIAPPRCAVRKDPSATLPQAESIRTTATRRY